MPSTDDGSKNGPDAPSLTHQTFRALLWVFSGTMLQAVLQIVVLMVLARLVEPAEFGLMGAATIIVGFAQIFTRLGVGPALVRQPNLTDAHIGAGAALSLLTGFLFGILIYLSAPLFAAFFRMPDLVPVVEVLALAFPITAASIVPDSLLQRRLEFRWKTSVELMSYAVAYGVVGLTLAFLDYGVWTLVIASLVQNTLMAIGFNMLVLDRFQFRGSRAAFKDLLHFGSGFSIARIGNFIATQGDNFIVGRYMGADLLGLYGRAYQFIQLPTQYFAGVIDKVLFPAMATVQDDQRRLGQAYIRTMTLVAAVMLPATAILVVLAPEIVHVLLGRQWDAAVLPSQILASSLICRTGYRIGDSLSRASGAVFSRAWRQWIYAAAVLGGAWIGHFWGLSGVAWGVSAALWLNFFLMTDLSLDITGVSWSRVMAIYLRYMALAGVIAAGLYGIAYITRAEHLPELVTLIIGGAFTAAAFLIMIILLRKNLGVESVWLVDFLGQQLPARIRPQKKRPHVDEELLP